MDLDSEISSARSAQDALRKDFIASSQHRSGFNPITGMEYDASKDDYRPRGRV